MTCDSGEDYDVAGVFFAEEREGRFDEVDLAEENYFELVADEVLGCGAGGELFDCAYDSYLGLAMAFIHMSGYVPSDVQQSRMSMRPKTSTASTTAAPHCPITLPSHLMPRILSFQPSLSFLPLLHSFINSLNSALRSSSSISWGGRPAAT